MKDTHLNRICFAALALPLGALLLGLVFWRVHDTNPMWAITSLVLVYDPDQRVALGSGLSRFMHTLAGALLAMAALWIFHPHRWILPVTLAIAILYGGLVLKFQGSWRVVLVTVTLILGRSLLEPGTEYQVVAFRAIEVMIGSALAVSLSLLYAALSRPARH